MRLATSLSDCKCDCERFNYLVHFVVAVASALLLNSIEILQPKMYPKGIKCQMCLDYCNMQLFPLSPCTFVLHSQCCLSWISMCKAISSASIFNENAFVQIDCGLITFAPLTLTGYVFQPKFSLFYFYRWHCFVFVVAVVNIIIDAFSIAVSKMSLFQSCLQCRFTSQPHKCCQNYTNAITGLILYQFCSR